MTVGVHTYVCTLPRACALELGTLSREEVFTDVEEMKSKRQKFFKKARRKKGKEMNRKQN